MKDLEQYAKENNIPIMMEDGIEFLLNFIEKNNIKNILEIGSAIGYSAIRMALLGKNIKVTTIERDIERYNEAVKNIKAYNLENQIEIINDDAFNVNLDCKYDLIFIDAAKSQYIKFFEKFKINLKNNGYIVSDNLNFHGLTNSDPKDLSRNVRGLVRKLNNYVEYLKNNDEFETEFYDIGDGVSISTKRKNAFTLVELLGVIVILAAAALIAFPPLLNQIKKSQNNIDQATKHLIINSAKLYVDSNLNDYPPINNNTYCLSIENLIQSNYLEKDIVDATKVDLSNKIVKIMVSDKYTYEIVKTSECQVEMDNNVNNNDTEGEGNIDYCFETNENGDGTVSISSYNCNFTDLIIPSTISGKKVTGIDSQAFYRKQLTTVNIPSGVTEIGSSAFSENQLIDIAIPDSVTKIGDSAFGNNKMSNDKAFIYERNSDGSINYAFLNSYAGANRENVVIPEEIDGVKLETIGQGAFSWQQLKSVKIPSSVTRIFAGAFSENLLTNIELPENLWMIGVGAFEGNRLTAITLPEKVKMLGNYAFTDNRFPDDKAFFYERNSDGSINYASLNSYAGANRENVVIPEEVNGIKLTTIGKRAFHHSDLSGELIIPKYVTNISWDAFGTNKLTSVTIPEAVMSIENRAFGENQLTSVTIKGKTSKENFTSFGSGVFGWASGYSDSNITWNG